MATKTFLLDFPVSVLNFSVTVMKMDSVDPGENFLISEDSNLLREVLDSEFSMQSNICGWDAVAESYPMNVVKTFPFFKPEIKINLTSKLDQAASDESYGFREISIIPLYDIAIADLFGGFSAVN